MKKKIIKIKKVLVCMLVVQMARKGKKQKDCKEFSFPLNFLCICH